MSLASYTKSNVSNTLATYLANKLLDAGYLIYWHKIDAVQTSTKWWFQYATNQATYLADPDFADEVEAAKGLLTLLGDKTAFPRYITRPTNSGVVKTQEAVPIPAIAIQVGDVVNDSNYEIGSSLKWRARPLVVEVFARDETEQGALSDYLAQWLDPDTHLDILNHDEGESTAIGSVDIDELTLDSIIDRDESEVTTFEVVCHARLEFVA